MVVHVVFGKAARFHDDVCPFWLLVKKKKERCVHVYVDINKRVSQNITMNRTIKSSPPDILPKNFPTYCWGRVKWFDASKGFGFISGLDGSEDVFVHSSDLACQAVNHETPVLYTGEYVQYTVVESQDQSQKSKAVGVTGIAGKPLMCENGKIVFTEYKRVGFDDRQESEQPLGL